MTRTATGLVSVSAVVDQRRAVHTTGHCDIVPEIPRSHTDRSGDAADLYESGAGIEVTEPRTASVAQLEQFRAISSGGPNHPGEQGRAEMATLTGRIDHESIQPTTLRQKRIRHLRPPSPAGQRAIGIGQGHGDGVARCHFRFMPSQGFRDALPWGARQKADRAAVVRDSLPQVEQGVTHEGFDGAVIQIQSAGCRAAHPGDTDRGTALRRFHDEVAEAFVTPVLTPQLRRRVRDRAIRRSGPGRVGLQLGIGMQREEEVIIGRCGRAQTQPRRAQHGGHGAVILRSWHAGTLPGGPR